MLFSQRLTCVVCCADEQDYERWAFIGLEVADEQACAVVGLGDGR